MGIKILTGRSPFTKNISKEFFFATLNSRSIVSFLENLIFYQPNSNKKNPVRNLFATLRSAEANVPLTVSYKSLSLCHLITISNIAHKKRPETRLCLMRMEWIMKKQKCSLSPSVLQRKISRNMQLITD